MCLFWTQIHLSWFQNRLQFTLELQSFYVSINLLITYLEKNHRFIHSLFWFTIFLPNHYLGKTSHVSSLFWFTIVFPNHYLGGKITGFFTILIHYFFSQITIWEKNHRFLDYLKSLFFKIHYFPHRKITKIIILPCLMLWLTGDS